MDPIQRLRGHLSTASSVALSHAPVAARDLPYSRLRTSDLEKILSNRGFCVPTLFSNGLSPNEKLPFLINRYRRALTSLLEEGCTALKSGEKTSYEATADGVHLKLKEPEPRARHAFVGFVDLEIGEERFECVIRTSPASEIEQYLETITFHPGAEQYMPRLYGIAGRFVVMERLKGAERGAFRKLFEEPEFNRSYARNVWALIRDVARQRICFTDVFFYEAHNVILGGSRPHSIRFVEQSILVPALHRTPGEIAAMQLFKEMPTNERQPDRIRYAFALLSSAFHTADPSSYYVRPIHVGSGHPRFLPTLLMRLKECHPSYDQKEIAALEALLADETALTATSVTPDWGFDEKTVVFNPDVIECVLGGNIERFRSILAEAGNRNPFQRELKDFSDPRSAPIVLR